ncbi:MAG: Flp pilus assembly protein CpaB [Selenomonadaceae bacterium]|nr:Flp pilus assembly protein CpaB [Selenomonadaceae bacterium]
MFNKLINKFNDMKPQHLLILAIVSAALAFAAVFIGMNLVADSNTKEMPVVVKPTTEKVSVVVAKVNIQPNTKIQESMLEMKEFDKGSVPEDAIKDFDSIKNVQIKTEIFAGDFFTPQKLVAEASGGFADNIPPDCRAVSINVSSVTGVDGFAKPGDRVDLLLVEKSDTSATSNILLQNVPLLSVNQNVAGSSPVDGNTGMAISNPAIATLALHPADILKLVSASKIGEIYMSLRPTKPNSAYVDAMEYTIESVNAPQPEPEPAVAPVIPYNEPVMANIPSEPTTPKIEIIQGDQVVTDKKSNNSTPSQQKVQGSSGGSQPLPVIPSNSSYNPAISSSPAQNVQGISAPVPSPPIVGAPN